MYLRWLTEPKVALLLRLLLAGVFVYAAVPKLLAPSDFGVVIAGYGLLPSWLVPTVAVALPAIELVVAVLLVLDRPGGVLGATILLVGFSLVLAYGIALGLDVDCGCFGPDDPEAEAYHGLRPALYRDLALLVCCGFLGLRHFILHHRSGSRSLGQTA